MKCYLCNNPAEFLCPCIEPRLLICKKHMKSHIRESGSHVFEFLPKVIEHSISAKIKAELHFLKKNAILKSNEVIGNIRKRCQQDLKGQNRDLQSEYLQRINSEISQIRESTRITLREIGKAIDSTKCKLENYELTLEFVENILLNLEKSKFLSPLLSRLEEAMKTIRPKALQIFNTEYVGEVVDGKANGRGIGIYDISSSEGYWENNCMNGICIFKTEMFSYYGEMKEYSREGRGIYKHKNGDYYDGEWKDDHEEGRGVERLANGDSYDGEWKKGKKEGKGVFRWANGDSYVGEWKESNKEGRGIYTWKNGNSYVGEWKEDEREGRGVERFADGDSYDGEWKKSKREGRGVARYANGSYDGEWKEDKEEGRGVERYANGDSYDGEWKEGKKEGRGIYKYKSGESYDGEWKENKQEGRGIYKSINGDLYDGEWKEGKQEGRGICKYKNGDSYDGEWKEGKQEGRGVIRYSNGDSYNGEWKECKKEGKGIYLRKNGGEFYQEWKNGVIQSSIMQQSYLFFS